MRHDSGSLATYAEITSFQRFGKHRLIYRPIKRRTLILYLFKFPYRSEFDIVEYRGILKRNCFNVSPEQWNFVNYENEGK